VPKRSGSRHWKGTRVIADECCPEAPRITSGVRELEEGEGGGALLLKSMCRTTSLVQKKQRRKKGLQDLKGEGGKKREGCKNQSASNRPMLSKWDDQHQGGRERGKIIRVSNSSRFQNQLEKDPK